MLDNLFYRYSSKKLPLLPGACSDDNILNASRQNRGAHISVRTSFCQYCGVLFRNKRELDEHLINEHDIKSEYFLSTANDCNNTNELDSRGARCLNCGKFNGFSSGAHTKARWGKLPAKFECTCGQDLLKNHTKEFVELNDRLIGNSDNALYPLTRNGMPKIEDVDSGEACADSSYEEGFHDNPALKKTRGLFICTICSLKFKRKVFLIKHCYQVHNMGKDYLKGQRSQNAVKPNMVKKKQNCSDCNKCYVRKSDLVRHRHKKHENLLKNSDVINDKETDLLKSAEMVVNGTTIYHCDLCKKNIVTKRGYIRHVQIHTGERPCTCHVCGKQYQSTNDLTRHLRCVHDGIKNYGCDICGRYFANKGTRNDHRRTHTGERPYVCHICGKSFPTANSIYVHRRIHTDYFPYQCSSCDKRFRRRQQLIHHVRTHTGEKPHTCDICGKPFAVKDELTRHLKTHSTDKPFPCSECGVWFAQKRYLRKHIRTHHNIIVDSLTIL